MSSSADVNVFQLNREWFFSRRVKFDSGFNVLAVFEVSWHGPEIISCFSGIRIWVLRWWRWSQVNLFDLLLELGGPASRWMFSVPDLLQQILFVHLPLEKWIFHFVWEIFITSLISLFFSRFPMRPSFPTPQCLQPLCHPSKSPAYREYPRNNPSNTFFPNWWILDWSFAEIG